MLIICLNKSSWVDIILLFHLQNSYCLGTMEILIFLPALRICVMSNIQDIFSQPYFGVYVPRQIEWEPIYYLFIIYHGFLGYGAGHWDNCTISKEPIDDRQAWSCKL